jgi:hypothetical protein
LQLAPSWWLAELAPSEEVSDLAEPQDRASASMMARTARSNKRQIEA